MRKVTIMAVALAAIALGTQGATGMDMQEVSKQDGAQMCRDGGGEWACSDADCTNASCRVGPCKKKSGSDCLTITCGKANCIVSKLKTLVGVGPGKNAGKNAGPSTKKQIQTSPTTGTSTQIK